MLNLAVRNTAKLVRKKSKEENVRLGRLFTKKETARQMASMFSLDTGRAAYTVLDPGAGTGILSAAIVERICKEAPNCKQIFLTCYENNPLFADMLEDNLERIRKKCRHDYDVRLFVTVYRENYITESKSHYTVTFFDTVEDRFDLVIANPPTGLVLRSSSESESVGGVTQVKVSEAVLFTRTAAKHLEAGGQLVIALPTNLATAASLAPFRTEMITNLCIPSIHLAIAKHKNLERAVPLGKTMLLRFDNAPKPASVKITTEEGAGKSRKLATLSPLPYDFVINPLNGSLTLPKTEEEAKIVKYLTSFPETLSSLGLKISTGLVLESRVRGLLFSEPREGLIPLLRPACIRDGQVVFPLPDKHQYLAPVTPALAQRSKNLILIKRVPAKCDARLLSCGLYLAGNFPLVSHISTHNKLNYIDAAKDGEMCTRFAYGLFALLNSTIYDRFLSVVTKSKQINAKEMRELPLPPRNIVENIGMRLSATGKFDVNTCDAIVNPTLHIIEK